MIERICRWIVTRSGLLPGPSEAGRVADAMGAWQGLLKQAQQERTAAMNQTTVVVDTANELIRRTARIDELMPDSKLRRVHEMIRDEMEDKLRRSDIGELMVRMNAMERILIDNAAVHCQEQGQMKAIVNEMNRRLWSFLGPGIPPSDGVVDTFRKTASEMGADLSKLDNNQLRGCLSEVAKALNTLDAESRWNG